MKNKFKGVYSDRYFEKKEIVGSKLRVCSFVPVLLFLAVIFSVGIGPVSADPGVIYVNNATGNDTWNGQSATWDGTDGPKLSLKDAVGTVNAGGTIHVADGIYNGADNRNITINRDMTIIGQSQTSTIIDAQNSSRIFTVNSGISLILQNLSIKNGKNATGYGGAIYSQSGNLTVVDSTFTGNTADRGGAIYKTAGNFIITGSTFIGNTADRGGAIYDNGGTFTVSGSTFNNNTATGYHGGAIFNLAPLTVTNCTFTGNNASNGGGAIYQSPGVLVVTNTTFTNNIAGYGAAINSGSDQSYATVTGCTFTGNMGSDVLYRSYGSLIVTECTFTGNTATSYGVIMGYATSVTVSFCRIVGNNGYAIYQTGSGSVVAANNWWGTNNPDLYTLTYGTVAIAPWIVLTVTADPETISPNGTSQIKADLTLNSRDYDTSSQGHVPDGVPVTFSAANGSINPLSVILVDGVATATFTPGSLGVCEVTATIDDYPASVNINRAPTLSVGNKTVNENKSLNFTVGGSDLDGDTLTYSATNLPKGATFNPNTGAFSWTPTYSQAGTYQITFNVFDSYSTTSETITITVNDVDNVPPKVTKVDPAKNAMVKSAKAIKVTFNEAVKLGGKAITLKNSSGKTLAFTSSVSSNVLTITPKSALGSGKYNLALTAGAVTDLADNALAAYSSIFTVDNITPKVSKIDPVNGATKVAAGKTIKMTFNEAIKAGDKVWVDLKNSSGKAVPFKYKISGKVLTIDPTKNLAESKYTLVIHTGAVTDLVGNSVAAKSTKFTVGTAPKISKVDPKNGATRVSRNKIIKATFNENISKGNYKILLKTNAGKTVKITKSLSGKILTIKHSMLTANTKYKLYIYSGSITDKAGNPVAAKTYTFTTGKTYTIDKVAPKVVSSTPKNNAVVSRDSALVVNFSENIKSSVNWSKIYVKNLKTGKKINISKTIKNKVLTIKTANRSYSTQYQIYIPGSAVKDTAGNNLNKAYTLKFKTNQNLATTVTVIDKGNKTVYSSYTVGSNNALLFHGTPKSVNEWITYRNNNDYNVKLTFTKYRYKYTKNIYELKDENFVYYAKNIITVTITKSGTNQVKVTQSQWNSISNTTTTSSGYWTVKDGNAVNFYKSTNFKNNYLNMYIKY